MLLNKYNFHQASPQKKDLYAWREIFNLYMEAAIFTNESEGQYTAQSYQRSQNQLQWFTQELTRMNLVCLTALDKDYHITC